MENFTPEKIQKTLKSYDVKPSKAWQNKVITKIKLLEDEKVQNQSLFFNLFNMKKLLSGVAIILVVAIGLGGYVYGTNTPYAKAMKHLENASKALEQLKNPESPKTAFIPVALAETSEDTQTVELIQTVENETDQAVAETESINNSEDTTEVLTSVSDVQDQTVDVLTDVIATSTSEPVVTAATTTIENTDASNEVVEAAIVETNTDSTTATDTSETANTSATTATTSETTTTAVTETANTATAPTSITEAIKAKREARRAQKLENVQEIMAKLQTNYDNMTDAMKKKYDTVKQLVEDCKAQGQGKCELGKAKGLAQALNVKTRNEERKAKREEIIKVIKEKNQEFKNKKEEVKNEIKEKKDELKTTIQEKKQEIKDKRDEKKQKLKDKREEIKAKNAELKESNQPTKKK